MFRGDVDRLYHSLRKTYPAAPPGALRPLDGVREIARYYAGLSQEERRLLLAVAKKEESGIGTIPLALSAIPFAGLLFGTRIQEPLARLPVWVVYTVWSIAGLFLVAGFYIHQRQKAYTTLHLVLLEQAIESGSASQATRPRPAPAPVPEPTPEEPAPPPFPGLH